MSVDAASRPPLVFAHANGFPGLSYRSLLNPLAEMFDLHPLDRLGHHPDYPVNHNWGNLVDELLSYLRKRYAAVGCGAFAGWHLDGHGRR